MDVQTAVGIFEKAMDDGQAQASACAGRLGSEIRLENLRQNIGRNARAVVSHGEPQ